ncbi:rhodanese-like domain-containing protein [Candidatus Enterococcus murrayae]|uniref:thiosulfate sulfurtransferase n=1 Tax=Candidatus Enterococcus murrayae TaxID=2815321 RepID=A0ABS3HFT0_9ENTE|nr:rhodanese-like domain-containing protein [Enterococcus sp. MJM16]MBO0451443.1 sulfurtransferase [Enterococcus sp. MJM16]
MKKIIIGLLALVTLGLAGCGSSDEPTDSSKSAKKDSTPFTGEYIVNADYVKKNLDDIILVDARGEEEAGKGTVKGATAIGWQQLASVEEGASGDEKWGLVLEPAELGKRLGEKGIAKDKEVVLFASAQKGWGDDGRIAWELLAAGYKDVKIVDGGFAALKKAGLKTDVESTKLDPVDVKIDSIDQKHIIRTDELKKDYDDYKIVDVREDKEYKGDVLYGEAKGGHLPDAIHIRFTDLFNKDGMLKSNKELTKLFEDAGLAKEDKIVTYCTAGIRSAYMELVMDMCGFKQVKNYDGSYYRWAKVEDVEK